MKNLKFEGNLKTDIKFLKSKNIKYDFPIKELMMWLLGCMAVVTASFGLSVLVNNSIPLLIFLTTCLAATPSVLKGMIQQFEARKQCAKAHLSALVEQLKVENVFSNTRALQAAQITTEESNVVNVSPSGEILEQQTSTENIFYFLDNKDQLQALKQLLTVKAKGLEKPQTFSNLELYEAKDLREVCSNVQQTLQLVPKRRRHKQ